MTEIIRDKFLGRCRDLGISLVGFAPVERWSDIPEDLGQKWEEWIPSEFWPQNIYPEVETVIVLGLPVTLPIVETAPSIFYHELYMTVNRLLDDDAYILSNYLTDAGFPSVYLPRDGYGDINVLINEPLSFFSHKHAAVLAGLGSLGLNNVLLTPEYGPRVRFTSIFTTAQLEATPLLNNDLCTRCLRCQEQCPVNAIHPPGKDVYFPPLMEKLDCAQRAKKLRETFNNPCGICIKVCPVGEDRKIFNRTDPDMYSHIEGFEDYHKAWGHVRSYGSKK